MPTSLEWTLAILTNTIHLALILIIVYRVWKFSKFSKLQALQKRYPFSVYLMSICIIFYLLQHLFYKMEFIHREEETDLIKQLSPSNPNKTLYNVAILSLIAKIFYCFSMHGMFVVLIARSWIIYFNTKWGLQMQKSQWTVHLNPNSADTFWFIEHRKDFGSPRFIRIVVLTYYLIESVLLLLSMLLLSGGSGFVDIAFYLIELVVLVTIWNKIPQFYDVFYIKKELQLVLRVGIFGLVLYASYVVKNAIFGYHLGFFMIVQCIFGVVAAAMVIILNSYVFTERCKHLLSGNRIDSEDQKEVAPIKYSLKDVLAHNELIQALFKHLLDEFSVELLLALIEIIQFEELMRNDDVFMRVVKEQKASNHIRPSIIILTTSDAELKLADQLPQSQMVYESHADITRKTQKYLAIAQDIARKYIFNDSEFEINISWDCKQEILSFIRNTGDDSFLLTPHEQYRLYILFHDAKQTLLRLLQSSHQRCLNSNRYQAATT